MCVLCMETVIVGSVFSDIIVFDGYIVHVDSLPYVEATILELLRNKTVIMTLPHLTMKDTEVGGYFIPGGTTVS